VVPRAGSESRRSSRARLDRQIYLRVTGPGRPRPYHRSVAPENAIEIRAARRSDVEAIDAIYGHYVRTTPYTFELTPPSPEARLRWFAEHAPTGRPRILVAVRDDEVVAFASSSRYRPRGAYDPSVETSVYVAPAWRGRGVGLRLYVALFDALAGEDVHRAYAGITMPNPASVGLHERLGFTRAGYFTEQGRKFGRYWDVAWYEKRLG
jgi:phosphinothricin acetyltransferase